MPMGISLNGNSDTVSREIADAIGTGGHQDAVEIGGELRAWLKDQKGKPRFAVVHIFSTHNFCCATGWLRPVSIRQGCRDRGSAARGDGLGFEGG